MERRADKKYRYNWLIKNKPGSESHKEIQFKKASHVIRTAERKWSQKKRHYRHSSIEEGKRKDG